VEAILSPRRPKLCPWWPLIGIGQAPPLPRVRKRAVRVPTSRGDTLIAWDRRSGTLACLTPTTLLKTSADCKRRSYRSAGHEYRSRSFGELAIEMKLSGTHAAAILSVVVVAIIVVSNALIDVWMFGGGEKSIEEAGQFGDRFGAANALFSGLAFIGLALAIALQRQELYTARDELRTTKLTLVAQQKLVEEQQKQLQKESYELTFFKLLESFRDSVDRIDLIHIPPNRRIRNIDAMEYIDSRAREQFELMMRQPDMFVKQGEKPTSEIAFNLVLSEINGEIGVYIRSLSLLAEYILTGDSDRMKFYGHLVAARTTTRELVFLSKYLVSPKGDEKLYAICRRIGFFDSLPHTKLG
jgi:hypothetical protein